MTTVDPFAARNGGAPFTPPATADEAREYIRANGIEFLFAQFVDMHGKPNAKLVPASHVEDLLSEGAGFAGFAAGDIGQFPNSPDMAAMPDVRSLTPLPFRSGVAGGVNGAPPFMATWSSAVIRVSSCWLPVHAADKRARDSAQAAGGRYIGCRKAWAMGAEATFSGKGVWSGNTLSCTRVGTPCRSLTVRRALCTSALGIAVRGGGGGSMADNPEVKGASADELDYAGGGLAKETNWWGAFVIGLAGTILVTGIAPVMVTTLGAASIPLIVVITITGYLLCLLLAELSAMMPERTGAMPVTRIVPARPMTNAPHQFVSFARPPPA